MKEEFITYSAKETMDAAQHFSQQLKAGDIVRLHGDLGAGKTTWMKGLAAGLGITKNDSVTSPTFSIMHRYNSKPPLYHFDCYRIHSPDELTDIGFEDFVNDGESIICIEWPEKAGGLIPVSGWDVSIWHKGGDERSIKIEKE